MKDNIVITHGWTDDKTQITRISPNKVVVELPKYAMISIHHNEKAVDVMAHKGEVMEGIVVKRITEKTKIVKIIILVVII